MEQLNLTQLSLTQEWDKVFPKSEKVSHCKVTFHTRYGYPHQSDCGLHHVRYDPGERQRVL